MVVPGANPSRNVKKASTAAPKSESSQLVQAAGPGSPEALAEKRFQEQCFLIENIEQYSRINKDAPYDNFIQLNGNPSTAISKLLGTGAKPFFEIEPKQLSLLQPKIRLFKLFENGSCFEFKFDDFTSKKDINELLKNKSQRGVGVGLKSFTWKDMGTNPGDTGKSFEAELTIHFQSVRDLLRERDNGLAFSQLIERRRVEEDKNRYIDKDFRILAEIGWQPPDDKNKTLFSKELKDSINSLSNILFLTLIEHDFDFREDGTVELKAKYIGALEGKMLSPFHDVLATKSEIRAPIKLIAGQRNVIDRAQKELSAAEKIIANKGRAAGKPFDRNAPKVNIRRSSFGIGVVTESDQERDARVNLNQARQVVEKAEVEIQEAEENIIKIKTERYANFLELLEENKRIFYVDLSKDQAEEFNLNILEKQISRDLVAQIRADRMRVSRQNDKKFKSPEVQKSNTNIQKSLTNALRLGTERFTEGLNNLTSVPKSSDVVRVYFVYLGDIINNALSIVYKKQKILGDDADSKLFDFILGEAEFQLGSSAHGNKKKVSIPLANIPISLNYFNAWFLQKAIGPQLDRWLFQDFVRDLLSDLVLNAIGPECFGDIAKSSSQKLSTSLFHLLKLSSSLKRGNSINVNDIKNRSLIRAGSVPVSTGKDQKVNIGRQYMVMYISSIKPSRKGEYKNDVKEGIYHLYIGSDRGIVKSIKFSRSDIQYLKEARITNSQDTELGDVFFSEPYNANVTLYGNSIFKPGMKVYIDSLSFGLSRTEQKKLPLGGYFDVVSVENIIEPGKYETLLKLVWTSLSDDGKSNPQQSPSEQKIKDTERDLSSAISQEDIAILTPK